MLSRRLTSRTNAIASVAIQPTAVLVARMDRRLCVDAFLMGAGFVACVAFLSAAFGWTRTGEAPGPAAGESPSIATLAPGSSPVRRRPEGELAWHLVRAGDSLRAGDTVYAPPDASAQIRFLDGSHLDLEEAALIVIDGDADGRVPQVKLVHGTVAARAPRRILVKTGRNRVVVDGGEARLRVGAEGTTRVSVKTGRARLEGARQRTEIHASQAGELTSAGSFNPVPPSAVRLTAPDDAALVMRDAAPLSLYWEPVPAASGYVVEIAADVDFKEIVTKAEIDRASLSADLPPGVYHWRVTARVPSGPPMTSDQRRVRIVDPRALVTLQPTEREVVRPAAETTFSWTELPGSRRYRVEVARDPHMTTPVIVRDTSSTRLRGPLAPDEGWYWWRVGASYGGAISAWSEPTRFRVQGDRVGAPTTAPPPPEARGK